MAIFPELKTACATVLVAVLLFSLVVLPVYRIWFSPLSKFPGPKLAAATLWYEFYYDVVLTGQYTFKIKDLHQKYGCISLSSRKTCALIILAGPIIRISPFELHIDDPEYYEVLYSNNLPLEKSSWYVQQFDIPGATFGTIDHKHHRLRRAAVNPFFSKQMINRLESTLRSNVDKLCSRLDEFRGTGQPLNMRPVYNALTTDITTLYAFNKSFGHFDSTDFKASWQETVNGALSLGSVLKQYPWLFKIIRTIPVNIVEWLSPTFKLLFAFENVSLVNFISCLEEADFS